MTVKLGEYSFKLSSRHFEVIVTCTFYVYVDVTMATKF